MKILFVSSGNSSEGISPIISNQGESIKSQGIDLDYFTVNGRGFKSYIHHVFILKKHLRNNKYDIIHAHYGLCGLISLLSKNKEKLVVSFMGDDLLGENKQDGSFLFRSRFQTFLNKKISKFFYDASIVKSAEMYKIHGKKELLFIVPNGIDLEKYKPLNKEKCRNQLLWNNNKINILFAANPNRAEKNFIHTENAITNLSNTYNIDLKILKNIPQLQIPIILNASDVVVLSSFHEGSPNIIKEAMACNRPIVSTNVGDIKWLFGDENGHYISNFSCNDFAEKINIAIIYSIEKKNTNGRARIIKLGLDSKKVATKIIDIYNKILN